MCKAVEEYEIDIIIMSSPDRRQISTRINVFKRIFKRIRKNAEIITLDSGEN